jgi:iron complex outermembrane recepter protein
VNTLLKIGLLVLASSVLYSQHHHIHGIVRDKANGSPLVGATVAVVGTTRGAITTALGTFRLHDGFDSLQSIVLEVRSVGFLPQRVVVDQHSTNNPIVVALTAKATSTSAVVVVDNTIAALPTTQQAHTISQIEADEHRGHTFSDILTRVPGVTVLSTGPTIKKPVIRGVSGARIVLRNAGLVQEGQQWGSEHAPEVDPFVPASISVVRGPASVLYGAGALGGVITINSRPLPTAPFSAEVSSNVFTNNEMGSVGGFAEWGSIAQSQVGVRVAGALRRGGNAHAPEYTLANTGFSEASGSLAVGTSGDSSGVMLYGSAFSTTLGVFRGAHIGNATDLLRAIERGNPSQNPAFTYAIGNPFQKVQHYASSLQWHNSYADGSTLRVTAGYQQNVRQEFDAVNTRIVGRGNTPAERAADSTARTIRALATPAMELVLQTPSVEAQLAHSLWSTTRGVVGASIMAQWNDRSGRVRLVPDYQLVGASLYAYEAVVWEFWMLSAGVRYDWRYQEAQIANQQPNISFARFNGLTGSVGVSTVNVDGLGLAANLSSGWRPPQMVELYANDVHHGVAQFEIGNPGLFPERVLGADITASLQGDLIVAELQAHAQFYRGFIQAVPDVQRPTITIRGAFPTFRYTQFNANIWGVDATATVVVSNWLHVITGASVLVGQNTTIHQPLFLMPANRGNVGIHVHTHDILGIHDAYATLQVVHVAEQLRFEEALDYAPPPPAYTLTSLHVGGNIHALETDIRLSIECTNLFNVRYRDYLSRFRYFADDPGRDIIFRLTLPFGELL